MKDANFQKLVAACEQVHAVARQQARTTVNRLLVARNLLLGHYIVEFEQAGQERAHYGESLLKDLSLKLTASLGRGFSVDSLELMRRFYQVFGSQSLSGNSETGSRISSPPISETLSRISKDHPPESGTAPSMLLEGLISHFSLSWSHYVALLSISDPQERSFYEIEAVSNDWSLRELKRQLDTSLYERLALSRNKEEIRRLAKEGQVVARAADVIKNPYVLEFLGIEEKSAYSESDLETAIIDKLEHFLLELGKGFLFEARQKRFTFDEDHYFVDLVFYNRLLRCYTLIDLKIGELTHQDLGQMQMYVNCYDRHVKTDHENQTIGIVLCKRKKDALVEITLPENSNIHASEYRLYLPTKEEFKAQIEAIEAQESDA